MIQFLARHLIPNHNNVDDPAVRRAYGILCGGVGIALNLLLFVGKVLAGIASSSVAITADAFNNLSDAASSLVTLLGFRLAAQKPDNDHPFGHGRFEYISGLVVSMIILLMGVELLRDSIDKIFHPSEVICNLPTVLILVTAILVKVYMALYNRSVGERISSAAMVATTADCISDCLSTMVVLLATLVGHYWGIAIDGWCGLAVAGFILWAGFNSARKTVSPLLGQPPEPEFVEKVHQLVLAHPEISGIHDLIVHDYGPGRRFISLHAEVPADGDILALHDVVDAVERELNTTMNCLAIIHMDPVVNDSGFTAETRERVAAIVSLIDPAITIHDFRLVPSSNHTKVIFDALVPHNCPLSDKEITQRICTGVRALDGNYFAIVEVEKGYI